MTAVNAHLNGGPMDDRFWENADRDVIYVAGPIPYQSIYAFSMRWADAVSIKQGTYRMRRYFTGDPVPHDLSGAIEYDWQGWDD